VPRAEAPAPRGAEHALLEREGELDVLEGLVRGALAGDPVLALVEGPAGIGKTRLLEEACERAAAAGFRVLTAGGSDLERELAFGVVRQLFEPILLDPAQRGRWLTGSALPAARIFAPPDDGEAAGDVSFGLLHGLFWLTANIAAEQPLVLAIDDLHWCDPASLRFIAYVERRLAGLRVLVAATARMRDPRADARLLEELAHDPVAVTIRPRDLSESAVAELVRERLGAGAEPRFCAACHRATGGNPLLLGELVKTLRSDGVRPDAAHADVIRDIGPRAVSRAVLLRLARLAGDAVAVARAVAVLGDGAALAAIATLAEIDEHRVPDAVRDLTGAEILRSEGPLGFVHPLVRDAVYLELSAVERELWHERAARTLLDLGAAPEHVAAHLLAMPCRGEPWVVALLREAGSAAARRGVAESAVSYLRRALVEPAPVEQRPQLLLELGLMEALVDAPAAAQHMSEALDRLDDPVDRALASEVLARMLLFTRPPQEAVAVARRAREALPAEQLDRRRALEAFELYGVAFGAEVPDAAERLAAARAAGIPDGVGGRMLGAVAAWDWAMGGGSAAECAELALEALAGGELIAADPGFLAIAANSVLALADRDEALDVWDATMREAQRQGSLFAVCGVNLWRGWTWLARGELAEAEDSLREAIEQTVLIEEQDGPGMAYVVAFLARVLIARGDLPGARAALAPRRRVHAGSDGDTLLRRSTVELLLAEADWPGALAEAEQYRKRLRSVANVAWAPWRTLRALALDGLGRRDEALPLLDEELAGARRWGAPGALAGTLRVMGTMREEEGLDLLREAAGVSDGTPARLEHARALAALGSALRRGPHPSEAREPLRRAFEIAGRCGAQPLRELVRSELHAAGARPRRGSLTGRGSLTPSERRVAELAAAGHSNRDIAQALFVTPKTVEVHLTSVYRKLGVTTRAALPDALA
jgi:DNA-binding CsgD family transcriptional regulator